MIEVNSKKIGKNQPVFVVAEIGKNFIQTEESRPTEEYLANAKELIKAAKEVGADAVKFQTHNLDDEQLNFDITSPHFSGSDRYSWIKRNTEATPVEFWQELKRYAEDLGIIFFSTPMSKGAAEILEQVDVPLWKVSSGDILDFVMLDYIAQTNKLIIISSGMSSLEELDKSVDFLKKKIDRIILMHCVSKYPCPPEDLNLKTIEFLKKRYDLPVGFSDHSLGQQGALAAIELGAVVIEKHFSFSRDLWGADHKVSMTPAEFKQMVEDIKAGKKSEIKNYGQESKILSSDEEIFRPVFRKSLVAARDLKSGLVLTKKDIFAMRPQQYINGLPSEEYENVLNKKIIKDLKQYDPITLDTIN